MSSTPPDPNAPTPPKKETLDAVDPLSSGVPLPPTRLREGRVFIPQSGITEYRPQTGDPKVDNVLRILRDDLYKLRRDAKRLGIPIDEGLTIDQTVEADQTFNPGGGPGVFLTEYLMAMTIWPMGTIPMSTAGIVNVDDIVAVKQIIPSDITINVVVSEVTTGAALSSFGVGWYDEDGNLAFETGPLASTGAAVIRTTLPTPVELDSGMYWHVWTCDNTSVRLRGFNVNNGGFTAIFNSGTRRFGTAAGGLAGVLPTTLPALGVAGAAANPAFCLFEID